MKNKMKPTSPAVIPATQPSINWSPDSKERFDQKTTAIQIKTAELKDIMMQNIDLVIERGEKIDRLLEKTENMKVHAQGFHKSAKNLNTSACCRFFKKVFCCLTPACCCRNKAEKKRLIR